MDSKIVLPDILIVIKEVTIMKTMIRWDILINYCDNLRARQKHLRQFILYAHIKVDYLVKYFGLSITSLLAKPSLAVFY